jgi:hypothetical protein
MTRRSAGVLLPALALLALWPHYASAQAEDRPAPRWHAPLDSSRVALRPIPASSLDPYLNDEAFLYGRERQAAGLWDLLLIWLLDRIGAFLVRHSDAPAWKYLFYALTLMAVVWLVRQLFGANFRSLFYRTPSRFPGTGMQRQTEDLRASDYERRIQEAILAGQYRAAIRLYYLQTLALLAERHQIAWKMDKTNHDYLLELAGSPHRNGFADITRAFEYAWYGGMPLDGAAFQQAQTLFRQYHRRLADGL